MLEAPTCTLTIVNIDPNYQCQNQRSSGLSLHYEQLRQDISLKIRLLARAALIVTWNSALEVFPPIIAPEALVLYYNKTPWLICGHTELLQLVTPPL